MIAPPEFTLKELFTENELVAVALVIVAFCPVKFCRVVEAPVNVLSPENVLLSLSRVEDAAEAIVTGKHTTCPLALSPSEFEPEHAPVPK